MANLPSQPGKIPSKQIASVKPIGQMRQSIGKIAEADQRSNGQLSARLTNHDYQKRLTKATNKYKGKDIPKNPKYRISKLEAGILIGVATYVDLIGLICTMLVWLAGAPEIIVEIVDAIFGVLFLGYLLVIKRFNFFSHWKIFGSILAGLIGEEIPLVNALPLWTLDALLIVRTIRSEDLNIHQQLIQDREREEMLARQRNAQEVRNRQMMEAESYNFEQERE